MTFKEALEAMKQGVPVKLPSWGGYWWWDEESQTILMYTKDADKGITLTELPKNIIITKAVAVVNKVFNAATTNVITVGTNDAANDLLGSSDITAGTANSYTKDMFKIFKGKTIIKVKYTQTGAKATAGEADIYLNVVRIPEA